MSPDPVAVAERWTVKRLLKWTADHFIERRVCEPADAPKEARLLLAHVLGCPPIEVIVRYDDEPTADEKAKFKALIRRRTEGWPVAYLVGTREFYLLSYEVTPAVLIPRPDTETLVMEALNRLKGLPSPSVLDLGTGSGCVAISIAHQSKTASVTTVDVSPDAIEVAKRNAAKHGVSDRVTFLNGDLFAPVPTDAKFDAILSNPPYIAHGEFADLSPDVRDHEPRVALDGGPDGFAFYRRIASDAGRFLKPGGWLLVEVGWTQNDAVRGLFAANPDLELGPSAKDLGGRFRVVTARKKSG